jgi:hypothetical protein
MCGIITLSLIYLVYSPKKEAGDKKCADAEEGRQTKQKH